MKILSKNKNVESNKNETDNNDSKTFGNNDDYIKKCIDEIEENELNFNRCGKRT